ncbi:MAG: hypothetical protein ACRCY9_06385, partial [Phycicoccus sp.]
ARLECGRDRTNGALPRGGRAPRWGSRHVPGSGGTDDGDCSGANRGALRLAWLGRPVKTMVGGIEGWKDEGFDLETS